MERVYPHTIFRYSRHAHLSNYWKTHCALAEYSVNGMCVNSYGDMCTRGSQRMGFLVPATFWKYNIKQHYEYIFHNNQYMYIK